MVSVPKLKLTGNRCGYIAVLLWSFSALFINWTEQIPPFLMAAWTSIVGFSIFGSLWLIKPQKFKIALHQKWQIWGLFFLSIVVYRGFYLAGLKFAPVIESNLLNYLWPIFIVLLGAAYGHIKLHLPIILGTALCFLGVLIMGLQKKTGVISFEAGHIFALIGALTWAAYSILTRRFPYAPTETMGFMHFAAIVIFGLLHMIFEAPVNFSHVSIRAWAGIIGWGLSISIAYKLWDFAMSQGEQDKVAAAAYFTPLLSTFWLVIIGKVPMSIGLLLSAALILGGSALVRLRRQA